MKMAIGIRRTETPAGTFYQWQLANGRFIRATRADWLALGGGSDFIPVGDVDAPPEEPDEYEFARMMTAQGGW